MSTSVHIVFSSSLYLFVIDNIRHWTLSWQWILLCSLSLARGKNDLPFLSFRPLFFCLQFSKSLLHMKLRKCSRKLICTFTCSKILMEHCDSRCFLKGLKLSSPWMMPVEEQINYQMWDFLKIEWTKYMKCWEKKGSFMFVHHYKVLGPRRLIQLYHSRPKIKN